MEIIEWKQGVSYAGAVEIPVSRARPVSKATANKASGNGTKKTKNTVLLTGRMAAEAAAADREITKANQRILVVSPTGRKTFMKLSEHRAS